MDLLIGKSKKNYEYISRYSTFWYYYNTADNKYIYGLTSQLSDDIPYAVIKVKQSTTLDSLAYKYYGRPDYFWVIADFNKIADPFINLYERFTELKIPTISLIDYKER